MPFSFATALSYQVLLRYRRRSMAFGAALVASCYAIDWFQPRFAQVALIRAAWITILLAGAWLQRPERPRLTTAAAVAASMLTGVAVVAIVWLDGGTASIYDGMLIATPYAALVVMVELPVAAAATGLVCVVGGALIRVGEGHGAIDVACWLLLSLVMTALATWGTVAARRAWRLEVDAQQAHARDVARLAEAERLAEIGRLAAKVAHDVNNPLSAARANLNWLAREAQGMGDGEPAEVVADTLSGLERIRQTVAQLQGAAREAGATAPAPAGRPPPHPPAGGDGNAPPNGNGRARSS